MPSGSEKELSSSSDWVTVPRGHFSRLYFKVEKDRTNLPGKHEHLERTNYEGTRYNVPDVAKVDKLDLKKIDDNLKDIWRQAKKEDSEAEEDIRLLREEQWHNEGSDYKYRYWLQHKVEETGSGERSLKILTSLNHEKEQAQDQWVELANEFYNHLDQFVSYMSETKTLRKDGTFGRLLNKEYAIGTLHHSHRHFPIEADSAVSELIAESIQKELLKKISEATIQVLFQTIQKTPRTLEDVCSSMNKKELVIELEKLNITEEMLVKELEERAYADSRSRELTNIFLKEKLVEMSKEDGESELHLRLLQRPFNFSQTPSTFLLKLYPRIKHSIWGMAGSAEEVQNPKGNEDEGDYKDKMAIKIARYIHFLLCQMGWIDINIANPSETEYFLDDDTDPNQISLPTIHRFSSHLLSKIDQGDHAMVRQFQQDPQRTMYCYPKPHRHSLNKKKKTGGGYFLSPQTRANDGTFRKLKKRGDFDHERFEPAETTIQALNNLQSTQWSINLDFLGMIAEFTESTGTTVPELDDIRYGAWIKTTGMKFQDWVLESMRLKDSPGHEALDKSDTRVQEWDKTLNLVRKNMLNGGNVFWHAWWCDWRGRFSTRSPNLGPQADDLSKALLLFTEWKPLGKEGKKWFYVRMYDYFSHINAPLLKKKLTFDERFVWTEENREKILKIGSDPRIPIHLEILGLDKPPHAKSEAFQRLAAALEFVRIEKEFEKTGNWDEVKSGYPIHFDASCNGFQHMAALLRDKELAEKVNVLVKKEDNKVIIGDLYQDVAEMAKTLLIRNQKCELREFLLDKLGVRDDEIEKWGELFSRNLCKKPVMVAAYGATDLTKTLANRNGGGRGAYVDVAAEKIIAENRINRLLNSPKNKKLFEDFYDIKEEAIEEIISNIELLKTARGKNDAEGIKEIEAKPIMQRFEKTIGYYSSLMRTIHIESTLYSELRKHNSLPQREKLFFDVVGGKPDKVENAILCWDFARLVSKHISDAISEVTGNAHKKIQDKLELVNYATKEEHFFWRVSKNASIMRGMKIKTKPNHIAGLRTKFKYGGGPGNEPRDILYNNCIKKISNNRDVLGLNEENIKILHADFQYLNDPKLKAVTQTKAHRRLRGTLFDHLLKLSDLSEKEQMNYEDDKDDEFREIEDLLVGLYDVLSIDVPIRLDKKCKKENWTLIKQGLTPNFIHSFDAKHMENVVNSLAQKGIKDFWAVHDSYGVHARDVNLLVDTVKDEFIKLHEDDFDKHFEQLKKNNNISDDAINVAWRHLKFEGKVWKRSKLQAYCDEHGIARGLKDTVKKLKEKIPMVEPKNDRERFEHKQMNNSQYLIS
ncbi:MAG: hypothetical protein CL926_01195 [Deltaproteobacteria bacterium]|nr:hypothetical protein [Deltaproteobacteria bacterium]